LNCLTKVMADANPIPADVITEIKKMKFERDDEEIKIKDINILDDNRKAIYATMIEDMKDDNLKYVLSVICVPKTDDDNGDNNDNNEVKNADDDDSIELIERIVTVMIDDNNNITTNNCLIEDKISMDDFSPSELIEYSFNGTDYFLSPMTKASCEYYRKGKYKNWIHLINNPDCEAAFKRLLKVGLINRLFDYIAFPSPDNEANDWIVVNEQTGKKTNIPRPVQNIRVWNVKTCKYESISPILDGAPSDDDKDKVWNDMLNKFKSEQGIDFINGLINDDENTNDDAKND